MVSLQNSSHGYLGHSISTHFHFGYLLGLIAISHFDLHAFAAGTIGGFKGLLSTRVRLITMSHRGLPFYWQASQRKLASDFARRQGLRKIKVGNFDLSLVLFRLRGRFS